jgi:hypothetical protein
MNDASKKESSTEEKSSCEEEVSAVEDTAEGCVMKETQG